MKIRSSVLGLVSAGLGLIVLGVAIALALSGRQSNAALEPTDFAAIPAAVRYSAPTLRLTGLDGMPHALSEYAGRVVLVNLWATWCPPCQAEAPILQSFFERHRAEGLLVLGVEDGEPAADVKAFVAQYALTYPIWLDPKHQATDMAFKTSNLPSSYVIDRAGTVRLVWFGAISAANLEKYVIPVIQEN